MTVKAVVKTNQKTDQWLNELTRELRCSSPDKVFLALRTVLHHLRDRLSVDETAQFAAQLPMLIRGCYYENWNPQLQPARIGAADMVASIVRAFPNDFDIDPEEVVRAVFRVIAGHVSAGEVNDVKACLPVDLRELWPPETEA